MDPNGPKCWQQVIPEHSWMVLGYGSFWGRQNWMLYSDEPLQLEGRIIGLNVWPVPVLLVFSFALCTYTRCQGGCTYLPTSTIRGPTWLSRLVSLALLLLTRAAVRYPSPLSCCVQTNGLQMSFTILLCSVVFISYRLCRTCRYTDTIYTSHYIHIYIYMTVHV